MNLNLSNKIYIVTGGSKGIGKDISWAIAEESVIVIIAMRAVGAATTNLVRMMT